MKRKRITKGMLVVGALAYTLAGAGSASAYTYYGQWINDWSGSSCPESSLSYTDDQINQFAGRMDGLGQTRIALYGNGNVWASDVIEDAYGGGDWTESDAADIYAYSAHGSAPTDYWGQTFQTSFHQSGSYSTCNVDSEKIHWGEQAGSLATAHGGLGRWTILCTCNSADTDPYNQWLETLYGYGNEYIMGYRGLSADSPTTDEVPAEWADYALYTGQTFKQSWFDAAVDWFVDDTAEVVTGGTSTSDANYRRDNLGHWWSRRSVNFWPSVSWAWHQG